MNWGYKILLVYCIFIAGIMFMVFKSSSQKMDLVTTDYYAKELKYQERIDATTNANALSEDIRYEVKDNQIIVFFPKKFAAKKIIGNVQLYCPSDERKDIVKDFTVENALLTIALPLTNKGQHELHISWTVEAVNYYFEKKIFIR